MTEPVTKVKDEPHAWDTFAPAADVYMYPAEDIKCAIEMVEKHVEKVENVYFRIVMSLFNEMNKLVPKLFCHTNKTLRETRPWT